ncbi:MAG: hypothetical protein IKG47_04375 [Oscillospiraceae bacterium]|nr:hypothetical protein [Oscillospiraceae bacterium]
MDKIISKIVALGVPGLILMTAIGATGLYGAASLTLALSAIGPGGMLGGIITLAVIGLICEGITEYGFDELFKAVITELYRKGETKATILHKIDQYPISHSLKLTLRETINKIDLIVIS